MFFFQANGCHSSPYYCNTHLYPPDLLNLCDHMTLQEVPISIILLVDIKRNFIITWVLMFLTSLTENMTDCLEYTFNERLAGVYLLLKMCWRIYFY
jgi:hypothetical protein